MITLTTEQAQQIETALMKIADLRNLGKIQPEVIAFETLYIIRAARSQEQEPVAFVNWNAATGERTVSFFCESELASEPLYAHTVQQLEQRPLGTAGALIDKWFLSKSGISENALIYAAPFNCKGKRCE